MHKQQGKTVGRQGFTLTELIIVIILLGILAGVAIPRMGNIVARARITATEGEMETLREALVGEESFLSHVGRLPTTAEWVLSPLIAIPAGVPSWNRWTESGWRGPYIEADGDEYRQDAWGNFYIYERLTPTSGQLTSHGPDGAVGGGDDIVLNFGWPTIVAPAPPPVPVPIPIPVPPPGPGPIPIPIPIPPPGPVLPPF